MSRDIIRELKFLALLVYTFCTFVLKYLTVTPNCSLWINNTPIPHFIVVELLEQEINWYSPENTKKIWDLNYLPNIMREKKGAKLPLKLITVIQSRKWGLTFSVSITISHSWAIRKVTKKTHPSNPVSYHSDTYTWNLAIIEKTQKVLPTVPPHTHKENDDHPWFNHKLPWLESHLHD